MALVVLDSESFYDDLRAQYDDDETPPVEELRSLETAYERLGPELELVFFERVHDLRNPMPGVRRGFQYSESASLPKLDYDLYSGNVQLCGFVHPPSESLSLARSVVQGSRALLERVAENGDDVSATERDRLAEVYASLATEVEELAAYVDDVEDVPDENGDEDEYDDWSFY